MAWRTESIEISLKIALAACLLLPLLSAALLFAHLPMWLAALVLLGGGVLSGLILRRISLRVLTSLRRIGLQLDALQMQDFGMRARPTYEHGQVAELHRQLDTLAQSLEQHRHSQSQHALLLHQLIDQLNTPILIFDQRLKLSYANAAFAGLFGSPWETLRNASASFLGLVNEPQWQFADSRRAVQWQIRHSLFWDQGHSHQLLVFINIQAALHDNQLQAWQKLIQVMSHEIRNSLTPVVALVQNLQGRYQNEREQQALQVIDERCRHLQDFVKRFAVLYTAQAVRAEWLSAENIFQRLADLFPDARLQATGTRTQIFADAVLLQQVLINLIKNAREADSPPGTILVAFSQSRLYIDIRVIDRGHGIASASAENLFVPFYSTKAHGQGIGLSLSRHLIQQMGGQLTLINNADRSGACATIRLPRSARSP